MRTFQQRHRPPDIRMKLLLAFMLLYSSVCLSQTRDVTGILKEHKNVQSRWIESRQVDVWLPQTYSRTKSYAVIYMHDGQNLFDEKTSFIGVDWGMDEMCTRLMMEKKIKDVIVVGIWNSPRRVEEYFPEKAFYFAPDSLQEKLSSYKTEKIYREPLADNYLKFITSELKPFIDSTYATKPDRDNTLIMGSSMGGLISLYAICEYPEIFGGAGCLSTHFPAGYGVMIDYMKSHLPPPQTHRIYFDYGTQTLDAEYEPYQQRADSIMIGKGFINTKNWITKKFQGDDHSERSWKKRLDFPLLFLLNPH
jgi:predicted alpha/beta superfamily hydrolase